jgi:dihydrodipicolinate synthase/N-acetylneuraminate lyase
VGAHALAASLMAGEFHKFTDAERIKTYEISVNESNGQVPVLAGVSHSGTEVAVYLAKEAEKVGADGVIVLPPYFNATKASYTLYEHYARIAENIALPVMIQDCEGVGPHMEPELWGRLAEDFSNIVSVKLEGPGTYEKVLRTKKLLGDELVIFGGMAARDMLRELKAGVKGNIPDACLTDVLVEVYEHFVSGNAEKGEEIYNTKYMPWLDFLSAHCLANVEVEKETLRQRGVIKSSQTRIPRGPLLTDGEKAELRRILEKTEPIRKPDFDTATPTQPTIFG